MMKKRILKSFCLALSVLLLFSVFGVGRQAIRASAAEQADETVATIYLCVSGFSFPRYFFGHTWICIRNESDAPLTVGEVTLAPGELMSAGLHSGGGLVYNMEMSHFHGRTVQALAAPLTEEALRKAESEITASPWHHYFLFSHNCTNFAAAVWQAATGVHYNAAVFPGLLKSQLPANELIGLYIG